MRIIKLSSKNSAAWLDFFDTQAFKDHEEWKGCYCTFYFYPKIKGSIGKTKREYAQWLIEKGYMQGYVVYENKKVIGWCNVGDKWAYSRLTNGLGVKEEGVKSIVCFVIQKEYRRQGIARKIVKRIIKDSKEDGTKVIEAYPSNTAENEYSHYHGPEKLYKEEGFKEEKEGNGKKVVYRIGRGDV
jgi:GNAT superfamily N-acetyltransferase